MVIRDQIPKMEKEKPKPRRTRRNKTTSLCMPRFGANACSGTTTHRLSLLDRLREAVFRLIMLSALSSKATPAESSRSPDHHHHRHHHHHRVHRSHCYSHHEHEPHRSEALADCIEFIKKSATADENRVSTTSSSSSIDAAADQLVVVPVPVM